MEPKQAEFFHAPRRAGAHWPHAVVWLAIFVGLQGTVSAASAIPQGELLATNGVVQFTNPKSNWVSAEVGMKLAEQDRLRTLTNSRAMVQLAELGRLRMNELTTLEILPP